MSTVSKKDSSELEDIYAEIYARIYESKPEDDKDLAEEAAKKENESDETGAAIAAVTREEEMEDAGDKIPPVLQSVFRKADKKLKDIERSFTSD